VVGGECHGRLVDWVVFGRDGYCGPSVDDAEGVRGGTGGLLGVELLALAPDQNPGPAAFDSSGNPAVLEDGRDVVGEAVEHLPADLPALDADFAEADHGGVGDELLHGRSTGWVGMDLPLHRPQPFARNTRT
jgi:hypothetical protein